MRRGLQITVFILSLIPAWYGFRNSIAGAAQFLPPEHLTAAIDGQFRFQSAWYFGLALILWWMIPQIEAERVVPHHRAGDLSGRPCPAL